jgi:hypothetical protein
MVEMAGTRASVYTHGHLDYTFYSTFQFLDIEQLTEIIRMPLNLRVVHVSSIFF